jgi:hypothetical protein
MKPVTHCSLILPLFLVGVVHAAEPSPEFGASWDNPRTAVPPVERPPTKSCTVDIVDHGFANFDPYTNTLTPPADCPPPWSRIVLDLDGSVRGRQYDRMAGIKIGGVTVLRTSTPEPSRTGISWHVEKDISAYAPLLVSRQPVTMELGNVVNETYTGVFQIKARVTFYAIDVQHPALASADRIALLQGEKRDGADVVGQIVVPASTERLVAELYATGSGGGCEEFWYLAAPKSVKYSCASDHGPYRELQVLLDGRVAGIALPYPNIWTGGWSNPYVWYVMPVPRAFDVRPFRFDLTPFVGVLNDGKPHEMRLRVVGLDAKNTGWTLLPTLHLWLDPAGAPTQGKLIDYKLDPLALKHPVRKRGNEVTVIAEGAHRLSVRGEVHGSRGVVETSLDYELRNCNEHAWGKEENPDRLKVEWLDRVRTQTNADSRPAASATRQSRYAIDGAISTRKDGKHDRLTTQISIAEEETWQSGHDIPVETRDEFSGNAAYTGEVPREQRHAVGESRERFRVSADDRCYDRTIAQRNGTLTEDRQGCR